MPKTVIVRQTWRCPDCDAEWDSDVMNAQTCPHCTTGIIRFETNPTRCGTMTVIGPEDIEAEIDERNEATHRTRRLAEIPLEITTISPTLGLEETHIFTPAERIQQVAQVNRRISELRTQRFFLETPEVIVAYRAQRTQDMNNAIAAIRLREWKP